MGAAFPRIARGNNNRRSQDRYLAFELIDDAEETIEAKLEKIGRFEALGVRRATVFVGGRTRAEYCDNAERYGADILAKLRT